LGVTSCIKKISHKSVEAALLRLECDTSGILKNIKEIRENLSCFDICQENHTKFPTVSISQKTVFIDGIPIISERADWQFAIFEILYDNYRKHYFEKETIFMKTAEIADILSKRGFHVYDTKGQIMRRIQKIQKKIRDNLQTEIIISSKWNGYAIKENVIIKKGG
jgi:predicted ribosome quality control (RQC) complex YloA/Tae2 family protein